MYQPSLNHVLFALKGQKIATHAWLHAATGGTRKHGGGVVVVGVARQTAGLLPAAGLPASPQRLLPSPTLFRLSPPGSGSHSPTTFCHQFPTSPTPIFLYHFCLNPINSVWIVTLATFADVVHRGRAEPGHATRAAHILHHDGRGRAGRRSHNSSLPVAFYTLPRRGTGGRLTKRYKQVNGTTHLSPAFLPAWLPPRVAYQQPLPQFLPAPYTTRVWAQRELRRLTYCLPYARQPDPIRYASTHAPHWHAPAYLHFRVRHLPRLQRLPATPTTIPNTYPRPPRPATCYVTRTPITTAFCMPGLQRPRCLLPQRVYHNMRFPCWLTLAGGRGTDVWRTTTCNRQRRHLSV